MKVLLPSHSNLLNFLYAKSKQVKLVVSDQPIPDWKLIQL